jgi:flagellar biosynthesis protein
MPERRRRVTALRYEGEGAPKVIASGQGHVAEKILAAAQAAGVPVREEPRSWPRHLARWRSAREVPEDLYLAVAEVLAWAYGLEKRGQLPRNGDVGVFTPCRYPQRPHRP